MIRSKFRSAGAALTLMFAVLPFSAFGQQLGTVPGKYNPGHYINLTHFDDFIEMQKAAKPGVVGFQRRYDWNELETAKNQYDFSKVRADLDNAKSLGLQFVVLVTDKTFDSVNPMPGYLNYQPVRREKQAWRLHSPALEDGGCGSLQRSG